MFLTMLAVLAAAPAPAAPAAKAVQLAAAKQWEELYLAFATAQASAYPAADKPKLAKALAQGCEALVMEDPVMAFSLGEKSGEFASSADGLYCTGLSGMKADQRGAAEEAFRAGVSGYPKDFRFSLELARLFAAEGDVPGARVAVMRIPKKAPEFAAAQTLLRSLAPHEEAGSAEGPRATASNADAEEPRQQGPKKVRDQFGGTGAPSSTGSRSYESGVDEEGRRVRANQYFRFRYFNGQKDFGQRAEYEGSVQGALDTARQASERILGVARTTPTDVIMYSKAEFELHHGPQFAQSIAGFYANSAIRMNDTAEINPRNQSVLVHEYVHAVVDELSNWHPHPNVPIWLNEGLAEYTLWQYEGRDVPEGRLQTALKQQALQGRLPPLESMSQGALVNTANPWMAYAMAASAVKILVAKRGMRDVIELIRECGAGMPFAKAYSSRYGGTVEDFDAEVTNELKH